MDDLLRTASANIATIVWARTLITPIFTNFCVYVSSGGRVDRRENEAVAYSTGGDEY